MFKRLVQKAAQVIMGGPFRLTLDKYEDHIALKTFKGKKPIPLLQLVKRYESLASIEQRLIPHEDWQTVPLAELTFVRQFLSGISDESLEIDISPEVASLQLVDTPADFEIRYVWSYDNARIEKRTGQNVAYFGNGWFVDDCQYWLIEGITNQDDYWLHKDAIEDQAIIDFLAKTIPQWQKRQLPFYSHLQYSNDPVLSITIKEVESKQISLKVNWKEPVERIQVRLSTKEHVIAAGIVRPGIHPQQITLNGFKTNGTIHLQGEEIALFRQEIWPLINKWVDGNSTQFQAQHTIFHPEGQIKLIVQHKEQQGIGTIVAIPTFVCSHLRIPAYKAAELLASPKRYYRIENGWLPMEIFEQAGITATNLSRHGQSLAPIILAPVEILHRGSERLQGVWSNVEFPVIKLPESELPLKTAALHLQFLKTWGIPGGIIDPIHQYQKAFAALFASLAADYPPSKTLVIGSKKTLDEVAPLWDNAVKTRFNGNKSDPSFNPFLRGIVMATPKALEVHPEIIKTEWNILCLLEADSLIKSNRSKLFRRLANCRQMLTIGSFGSDTFLKRTQSREAMSQLFGLPPYMGGTFVWGYALRNPAQKARPLPPPYRAQPADKRLSRHVKTAEFHIGQPSGSGALPIPPRSGKTGSPIKRTRDDSPFQIEVRYTSRESSFVKQAKKLVNHSEKSARFVPFQQYWPQYGDMTAQQRKWYFYWRSEVRKGNYPDTDLSYIFVHAYELINNVGVKNEIDGYTQLHRLWLNYRKRFPKLDNYLLDWMADYVLVNKCPVDPLKIYADAAIDQTVSYRDFDLILANYLGRPLSRIPIFLIEKLTDYQIQRSKFYTAGHQQLVNEYVPQTLEQINLYLKQTSGVGIFERFKPRRSVTIRRRPFQGALYDGQVTEITLATILPYTRHQPLRDFLTAIVKHTENKLRELKNHSGRLRGYTLDPAVQAVIDRFIASVAHIIVPPPPKPKVEIDFAEVARLKQESSKLFQMLQVPEGDDHEIINSPQPVTPPASQIILDPVELQKLQEESEQLFRMLQTDAVTETSQDNRASMATKPVDEPAQKRTIPDAISDGRQVETALPERNHELPAEWVEFAQQLADYQFQTIKAIVTESDPGAAISQIAEANVTMPEPLLDGINELAQDTVGDIIIDTYPAPHISDEEYLDLTQKLVAAGR